MVAVPSVSQLKRMAGNKAPYLAAVERLSKALAEHAEPFTGKCQFCNSQPASLQRLVSLRYLVARHVSEREGLQPSATGMALAVGAANERWHIVQFPLLFCGDCHKQVQQEWRRANFWSFGKTLGAMVFYVPLVVLLIVLSLFIPFVSIGVVVLVVVMAVRYRTRKKVSPFIREMLSRLPLVCDVMVGLDEYEVEVAPAAPVAAMRNR